MKRKIGWRETNQTKNKWWDRDAPEWPFYLIFILVITSLTIMVLRFPQIYPTDASEQQMYQTEVKTSVEGQNEPKNGVVGVASWYDYSLDGIEWSKDHDTCAARDYKRYSTIRVTNLDNGKSVDCYVNDYGPELGQTPERHVDLSSHAFNQIEDLKTGLANVSIQEIN